jgi:hypothetical protein
MIPTRFRRMVTTVLLTLLAAPLAARAQTATIYRSLGNFDVVNNAGHDAHGFEIELEGLQPADVVYTFSMQRYGGSTIIPTATGVAVRWTSAYDAAAQRFVQTTVAHLPGTPFVQGMCYQLVPQRGTRTRASGGALLYDFLMDLFGPAEGIAAPGCIRDRNWRTDFARWASLRATHSWCMRPYAQSATSPVVPTRSTSQSRML